MIFGHVKSMPPDLHGQADAKCRLLYELVEVYISCETMRPEPSFKCQSGSAERRGISHVDL